jgi:transposase-like protein
MNLGNVRPILLGGPERFLSVSPSSRNVCQIVLVQERRDVKAAKRFFRRLLNRLQYVLRMIVTDKLRSYGAAPGPSSV